MKTKLFLSSVLAAVAMTVLLPGAFAAAQDQPDPYVAPSPTVSNDNATPPSPEATGPTDVASKEITFPGEESNGSTSSDTAASTLAFTGGDVVGLAAIGLAAIGVGFAMVIVRNRHGGADSPA